MGLTLPMYFSGKWDQNLYGQTTMQRCGASTMQQPLDPRDVGVRAACLIGVVSTAPKSLSRLRCLSQWCLMAMQSSSLEQQCLSSARKSAVARLATGARGADGARGAVGG
jgi:hypothetical protein